MKPPSDEDELTWTRKEGQVVRDQLRTVDKTRLVRRLGRVGEDVQDAVLVVLAEMFAP